MRMNINAEGLHYRQLNEMIHDAVSTGSRKIIIDNVCGQRYIGDAVEGSDVEITINGTPGNDMAAFMNGPCITVNGNAQDAVCNTMNAGKVVIHGSAGDILGYAMRGGRIFVRDNVGFRVGIHMKAYKDFFPVVVIGGNAGDFLGEYMAGGLIILLGHTGDFIGTGMHGGSIFIRGRIDERCLGREVKTARPDTEDMNMIKTHLTEYCRHFDRSLKEVMSKPFTKLYPYSHRPYGKLYAY